MKAVDYKHMHNEELIDLLFTEEDRLPLSAVQEIVYRSSETFPLLSEIVVDKILWTAEPPDWWAPIHATYIVGAIGGPDSLGPLMSALRWSDAYDNEWVTEDLPLILGALGDTSWGAIKIASMDRPAGWSARSIAMDALGSQAFRFPNREEEAMRLLGGILKDTKEDYGARRSAAYVLLDFRRANFKRELIAFAKEEDAVLQQYPEYRVAFTPKDVERDLATPRLGVEVYARNWMEFYSPEEIARRQAEWARDSGADPAVTAANMGRQAFIVGREDACPCGSGKSYKRCCWRKLH